MTGRPPGERCARRHRLNGGLRGEGGRPSVSLLSRVDARRRGFSGEALKRAGTPLYLLGEALKRAGTPPYLLGEALKRAGTPLYLLGEALKRAGTPPYLLEEALNRAGIPLYLLGEAAHEMAGTSPVHLSGPDPTVETLRGASRKRRRWFPPSPSPPRGVWEIEPARRSP
jgi:hypothetical protein